MSSAPDTIEARTGTSAPSAEADAEAVRRLITPRSITLVGASDRSRWSAAVVDNLRRHGFSGPLHFVNRRGADVAGQAAAVRCVDLGQPVDLGVVVVPAPAVADAVADLGRAGATSAVLLTSGFAEVGADGAALQADVLAAAAEFGVRLLGPNSLGFMNVTSGTVPWAAPVSIPRCGQGVALVSQSGATAYFLARRAVDQGVDLHSVVATGNEADLDASTVALALLVDPSIRAVALFLESVRRPDRFVAAAEEARRQRKPLVVLKVGASEISARSALAHTGAVVGDDRAFDGVCARLAVTRVHSLEELITCADVLGRTGPLGGRGLALISNSGGVCEIAADAASDIGLELPAIPDDAADEVRQFLPSYATPHNPLDFTGGIEPDGAEGLIRRLGEVPEFGALLVPFYPVSPDGSAGDERQRTMHEHLGRGLRGTGKPGFLVTYTPDVVTVEARRHVESSGLPYLACGMDQALTALAKGWQWSRRLQQSQQAGVSVPPPVEPVAPADRPNSEWSTLELLTRRGVPTVPHVLATTEDEAVAAARRWDCPVAVKIASADIAHKSEIGGVALGASGEAATRAAFARVLAAGQAQPGAVLDGVIVTPMRTGGLELFVGCSVDPTWGPVMAVGLGGIWVEILKDVAVRPLPVSPSEVVDMLRSLRGARMLAGERGTPAADLERVGEAVAAIGRTALAMGSDLAALEVNPLWVNGSSVEALDGLVVWS